MLEIVRMTDSLLGTVRSSPVCIGRLGARMPRRAPGPSRMHTRCERLQPLLAAAAAVRPPQRRDERPRLAPPRGPSGPSARAGGLACLSPMAQLVAGIAGAAGAAAGGGVGVGVEREREADDMAQVQPTQESAPTPQPEPEHRPLNAHSTLVTAVKGAPVTYIRNVDRITDLDQHIEKPHVPRANLAISREHPDGEPQQGLGEHLTVLQQHVAWFDFNKDGILQPWETYKGFRLLGWNPIVSLMATFVIHASFSFPTHDSWLISPTLPIYIRDIHSCKHGSDSETYDTEGRFVVEKFEEMFSKYDTQNKGGFYFRDILRMVRGNFNVYDPFGWFAESSEWTFAWWLAKDRNGFLSKEATRGIFDGTFLQHVVETQYKKEK